jgi:Allantoicase
MGNGWEIKEERGSGYDWVVIKLGKFGLIEKFNIETHFLKVIIRPIAQYKVFIQ